MMAVKEAEEQAAAAAASAEEAADAPPAAEEEGGGRRKRRAAAVKVDYAALAKQMKVCVLAGLYETGAEVVWWTCAMLTHAWISHTHTRTGGGTGGEAGPGRGGGQGGVIVAFLGKITCNRFWDPRVDIWRGGLACQCVIKHG